jgi:hypothetical protein
MQYPTIGLNALQNFLVEVETEGLFIDPPQESTRGTGEDFFLKYKKSLYDLSEKLKVISSKKKSNSDLDEIEGKLSSEVFRLLYKLPTEILTDPDFWRYLCATTFFQFIIWRDGSAEDLPARASFGASSKSITMDCVPFRMFNRGLINFELTGDLKDDSYASIPGTDVWRSHILRVKTSFSPNLTRNILEKLESGKLPTSLVRPLAKRLRRLRSNVIFEILEPEDANLVFSHEYDAQRDSNRARKNDTE